MFILSMQACTSKSPRDILKSLLDIGGKELVVITDSSKGTVLHSCCCNYGTSPYVMKLIDDV